MFPQLKLGEPRILMVDLHMTIIDSAKAYGEIYADEVIKLMENKNKPIKNEKILRARLSKYLEKNLGPPIISTSRHGMENIAGFIPTSEERNLVVQNIRAKIKLHKFKPFPEIPTMFRRLKEAGWHIVVSSDNPQELVQGILKNLNVSGIKNGEHINDYIDGVYGYAEAEKHKIERHLPQIIERFRIDPEEAGKHIVYYGDSKEEMRIAKKLGIIGVGRTTSYSGFGMWLAGAKRIIPGTGTRAKFAVHTVFPGRRK